MNYRWQLINLSAAASLLILLVSLAIYAYGTQHKVPRGVTISGLSVEGVPFNRLEQELQRINTLIQQQQVLLLCEGNGCKPTHAKINSSTPDLWSTAQLTLQDLGMMNNLANLRERLHSMDKGIWFKRAWIRWRISGTANNLELRFESAKLQAALQKKWPSANSYKPVNAYRSITSTDSVRIHSEISAFRVNVEELHNRLMAVMPDSAWLQELEAGKPLSMQITLPLLIKAPAVTASSLKAQGVSRKISQFTTTFNTSAAGRIHNIRASARTMQDQLLAPGEIFDYSQVIRQTEKNFGYQEAPVIYNGKLVPGIGGGICQVSTTLYNAVLRAGLQIVERRNHSLPISYAPLGQDATFASDYINFRFRNNTSYYLLIRTSIVNNTLTVKLFGTMAQDKSYDIASVIVERLQPTTKFLYNAGLGKSETQIVQSGKLGYIVETYRYQKQGGAIIKKELISRDTYPSQPNLVAVGEEGRVKVKPEKSNLLEDGVRGPSFN